MTTANSQTDGKASGRWAFGLYEDDDAFQARPTRAEAIRAGAAWFKEFADEGAEHFFIASVNDRPEWEHLIRVNAEAVLDQLLSDAADRGELPENSDWLLTTPRVTRAALTARLNRTVQDWVKEFGLLPNWWEPGEMQRIKFSDWEKEVSV